MTYTKFNETGQDGPVPGVGGIQLLLKVPVDNHHDVYTLEIGCRMASPRS